MGRFKFSNSDFYGVNFDTIEITVYFKASKPCVSMAFGYRKSTMVLYQNRRAFLAES